MYPSLDELIASLGEATGIVALPESLIALLRYRYNEHGMEYATSQRHPDGRITNKCMYNDSIQDAQEELNDAIFNLLVAILKQGKGYRQKVLYPWAPRQALNFAIQAWISLSR